MALAREVLRLATVRALRGRVWGVVRDSEQGPIEDLAAESDQPVIAVYTDDGACGEKGDLFAGGEQTLLIEIAMTRRMRIDGGDDEAVQPVTDAAMELAVGLIERQIKQALGDPANEWADVWRRLVLRVTESRSVRGTMMREGVRFAGRQIQLTVVLVRDPAPGAAPAGVWADILTMIAAEPGMADIAARLGEVLAGRAADWPASRRSLARFALSEAEGRAPGILPPLGVDEDVDFAGDVTVEFDDAPSEESDP